MSKPSDDPAQVPTKPTKADVARQFGRTASAYVTSAGHAHGSDLDIVIRFVDPRPDMRVLDVATGGGHVAAALAPHVASVTATDLTAEMVDQVRAHMAARSLTNVDTQVMDVEQLAFPDHSFDAVTCRIAAHHFLDIRQAVRELVRVLAPAGRLVIEDSCSPADPELDRFLDTLERLRDPTHVRAYSQAEWAAMLAEAGRPIVESQIYRKTHRIDDWVARAGCTPEQRARVAAHLATAPAAARDYFAFTVEAGRVTSYTDDKLILRA